MATPEELARAYALKPKSGVEGRLDKRATTPVAQTHGERRSNRNAGTSGQNSKYPARA